MSDELHDEQVAKFTAQARKKGRPQTTPPTEKRHKRLGELRHILPDDPYDRMKAEGYNSRQEMEDADAYERDMARRG